MCGIAGFWDYNKQTTSAEADVVSKSMIKSISHRGPDSYGVYWDQDSQVMLTHRRLAIIDLSPAGHQPMSDLEKNFYLIFNGEIYNYQILKKQLEAQGVSFVGSSDTEVLLQGFKIWGVEKTLQSAEGMFAFCLLDRKQKKIYLGRDRIGEKPLYYGKWQNKMYFASELKAILDLNIRPNINGDATNKFLSYGSIAGEDSILDGFKKVKPAHFYIFDLENKSQKEVCYWDYKKQWLQARSNPFENLNDAKAALEVELKRVVQEQMISDVPLGAFLSGGIDSSLIVATMAQLTNHKVKTFTIGFNDARINEAHYAKKISEIIGTEHTELYLGDKDLLDIIPKLSRIYDEPFADASQIPTFLVSQLCRQKVTVALSGDAGDELFAGYDRYKNWGNEFNRFQKIPKGLRYLASNILKHSSQRRIAKYSSILMAENIDKMYESSIQHWVPGGDYRLHNTPLPNSDNFDRLQALDIQNYLPDDILVKVDRASMANSLETRIPFLNHKLIEMSWRIPFQFKLNNGESKYILKEMLRSYLPDELIFRSKQGFAVPLESWLRGPLKNWAYDLIQNFESTEYVSKKHVLSVWAQHQKGINNSGILWDVLMLQDWKKQYGY